MTFYNSDSVDETQGGFDLLPAGTYKFRVVDAIIEETKAKQQRMAAKGTLITTKLEVLGGEHNGRTLFHRFNIENDNQKAELIGRADFKVFHKSCGLATLTLNSDADLRVLQNRTVAASVEVDGKYNRVASKSWKELGTPQQQNFTRSQNVGGGSPALNDIPF